MESTKINMYRLRTNIHQLIKVAHTDCVLSIFQAQEYPQESHLLQSNIVPLTHPVVIPREL